MLRFVVLAFAVLWVVAIIGRFAKRASLGSPALIRGSRPAHGPELRADRLIGVLRMVIGVFLVIGLAGALSALTDLSDIVALLIAAPVAGIASGLITERFVTESGG